MSTKSQSININVVLLGLGLENKLTCSWKVNYSQ